jgi:hypothetical protein
VAADLNDVYEQVIILREDVAYIKGTLENVHDHEQRIRWLEKWKWGLPATLITSVLAAGTVILTQVGS